MTEFVERHIGVGDAGRLHMLATVGYASVEELMASAVPSAIAHPGTSSLIPEARTEAEVLSELRSLASRNRVRRSFIGQGYYGTHTPSVIARNVFENPAWYTAYTPYQPEISQGRLEALLAFQTMVADLTGMSVANASMLDEATAAAEGMLLARRVSQESTPTFVVDRDVFEHTRSLLNGRAEPVGIEIVEADLTGGEALPECFGVLLQNPGASGRLRDPSRIIADAHDRGAVVVQAADLLSLTLVTPPGEAGADVVVGTTQRFGIPLGYGGPHAGFLAVRAGLERNLPGRLVGVTRDANGEPAYRLTLQAREQHIRREKATSNICTAQVLLAVMAGMYGVYHGPEGLRAIAAQTHSMAVRLAEGLVSAGIEPSHESFFDTLSLLSPRARDWAASLADRGYLVWQRGDEIRLSVDETTTLEEVDDIIATLGHAASGRGEGPGRPIGGRRGRATASPSRALGHDAIPVSLRRTSDFMTHRVFHEHRSETRMMRVLRRLADFDYALDRGMIPLGSCTMKLNSATEMTAVSWPGFAGIHPFAPQEDTTGYDRLIRDLEVWLADVTGYDSVSLQPNAGSQGELAGLLAIREYHRSRGQERRTVCLIPSSAHGTNAASAVLAGMTVVVVACDDRGNIDLTDVRTKIADAGDALAALMMTYPSTHGVYEHDVLDITAAVHEAGGQVYVDGANMNAMTGYARYGDLGGDVSHLNLHKTFCIPHGGGGPGVGPVAAKAHLAPFLPGYGGEALAGRTLVRDGVVGSVDHAGPQISAAPWGSPSILPISWAYVRLMGREGLRRATAQAVLSANYVATRLRDAYPVLYAGDTGLVAHECILDLRPLTAETGITVDDVAKRLIDYGFHAPTMSFPVAGTLMVEPTESEDLDELDRFIDAMLRIHAEARSVADGTWPAEDNPLVNAPHTAADLARAWGHPYDREIAAYPFASGNRGEHMTTRVRSKYWPPVRRVDNAFGDRNLQCACPPPEAFA